MRTLSSSPHRLVFAAFAAGIALFGALVIGAAPATAAPASVTAPASVASVTAVGGDVSDFVFDSLTVDYTLERAASGTSILQTREHFVANFSTPNQNKGMNRIIPTELNGVPLHTEVVSVTDAAGIPREFTVEELDGGKFLKVRVVADSFVEGLQSYIISYRQENVVEYFADVDADELKWNVNGLGWAQPFRQLQVTLTLGDGLDAALTGESSCYYGLEGSTSQCDIASIAPNQLSATVENLGPGHNVTIAVGFAPGTFLSVAPPPVWQEIPFIGIVIALVLVLITAVINVSRRIALRREVPKAKWIVPQYVPPKGFSILTSAAVLERTSRTTVPATMVDLSVRGYLHMLEEDDVSSPRAKTDFLLELVRVDGLRADEQGFVQTLFGTSARFGDRINASKQEATDARLMQLFLAEQSEAALAHGWLSKKWGTLTGWMAALSTLVLLAGIAFLIWLAMSRELAGAELGAVTALAAAVAISAIVARVNTIGVHPSVKGRELVDYLNGIREYIALAEQERFALLQSPEGAARTGVNAPDGFQVVKIYEKLLPYAILFGQETEWATVIGKYYEQLGTEPDWYRSQSGTFDGAFTAVALSSAVSGFATDSGSSFSYSDGGSSGGGGSAGGGSSGDGGGGGGGGGE